MKSETPTPAANRLERESLPFLAAALLAMILLLLSGCDAASAPAATTTPTNATPANATPVPTLASSPSAGITLLGFATVPADAHDESGITAPLEDGTPYDRLGGFGSGIDYTGKGNRYFAVADRGPKDGGTTYRTRFQELEINIDPAAGDAGKAGSPGSVTVKCVGTKLLYDAEGRRLIGLASQFEATKAWGKRFDPEGIRVAPNGNVFISDEYGPDIAEFTAKGDFVRELPVPESFRVEFPDADKDRETSLNMRGRVTNKGFEGLAISPDGSKLFALLQGPLIQDQGKLGQNVQMLEIELATGRTRQLVAPLAKRKLGYSELLAVNDHQFLAIERDNQPGNGAESKTIVMLDIAGASDVSAINSLPATGLPAGVKPVTKSPFIDLLDPRFGLKSPSLPEKIEGITFGPNLHDGRRTLVMTSDNDFKSNEDTFVWVFAIPAKALH